MAYERIASAITIAEELQLGYTRPELPLSPVLKNTRFVYYNPIDCSLKVSSVVLHVRFYVLIEKNIMCIIMGILT